MRTADIMSLIPFKPNFFQASFRSCVSCVRTSILWFFTQKLPLVYLQHWTLFNFLLRRKLCAQVNGMSVNVFTTDSSVNLCKKMKEFSKSNSNPATCTHTESFPGSPPKNTPKLWCHTGN